VNLPLTDGAFLIDNSGIEQLRCPRLFQYSFIRRRSLVSAKAGRNFGSGEHVGLARRYLECNGNACTESAFNQACEDMRVYFDENPQPMQDFRDYNHACVVLRAYNEVYGNEPFEIVRNQQGELIVEKSFMLPFCCVALLDGVVITKFEDFDLFRNGSPLLPLYKVYYCGKLDLGIRDGHGLWVMDHKTTFQFGDTFDKQMQMDGGQIGYCWALSQVTGEKPRGYIIDAIRVRRPKREDIFTGAAPCDASDFKRMPFFITDDTIQEWRRDTEALIQDIFTHELRDYYPRHRWHCTNKFGTCDFFDVCSVSQASRESALASGLFEDNEWSPLNPVTRKGEMK
jgi:hypothetical protein